MGLGVRVGAVQPMLRGFRGCLVCVGVLCVSDTAQVELRSERVYAPACKPSMLILHRGANVGPATTFQEGQSEQALRIKIGA
jgi:hypothetical protein